MRCNVCCEFILRKTKALSLIHYITDYQTELSSKTYHRVAFAAGLRAKCPVQCDSDIFSESKRFLIQTFNKLATNREISAVEIAHVSLGYPEFYSNKTYRTISLTALYAAMKYKFVDMAYIPPEDNCVDDQLVVINNEGQEIPYFQGYQNRPQELLSYCLYDFTSVVNIGKGSRYTFTPEYIVPSFSGSVAHYQYHTPEGHSRYAAIILGLFLPWHLIPIIVLGVSGPKTFVTVLSHWMEAHPIPNRICNLIANFDLMRKSAAEVQEDRSLRAAAAENEVYSTVQHTLDDYEDPGDDFENTEAHSSISQTTTADVILALDKITSTNLQQESIDLVPLSSGDDIISNIITLHLSNGSRFEPGMPESISTGIFDEKQFPIFENNDLSAWKALLKSQ